MKFHFLTDEKGQILTNNYRTSNRLNGRVITYRSETDHPLENEVIVVQSTATAPHQAAAQVTRKSPMPIAYFRGFPIP